MSNIGAFICGLCSMLCIGAAFVPSLVQWIRSREGADLHLHPRDDAATMADKLERRCQNLGDARHRLRSRAAELRGLKWDMEHLGASHNLAPYYSDAPTLGQQIYKNRIARLDREIYRLRVCEKLTHKMQDTARLILEMLAVEAHVDEIMPELDDEPSLLVEQLSRYRELEGAFEEVKLRSLAADEVAGLLER